MTDGRPLCCVCYERVYAVECATCRQTIHVTDGHMLHGSRRWHAADSCFRCDSCACSLLGCPFVAVPGKDAIFCATCGVTQKSANSASYTDKRDGAVGVNCVSPSSPMMKVHKLTSKAFYSKFEDVDSQQSIGYNWCEESPVKAAAKWESLHNSSLQYKSLPAESQTHLAYTNSTSCCDDHRLSGEFDVCASTSGELGHNVLMSQPSSHSEKTLPHISHRKQSVSDLQTTEVVDMSGTAVGMSSPRPPVLIVSAGDCLDNAAEINCGLEELIVEPSWNRSEPDGLVAEATEVVGISDDVRQKSRKSKNLNVRFDPSTKAACSPDTRGVYYERRRPSSHRSLDDSDISYVSCRDQCHAVGRDGSASVRIGRRKFGHGRHGGQGNIWSDVDAHGNEMRMRNERPNVNRASGWWVDTTADYEHCSTCSSSSSDSDFDYGDVAFSSRAVPIQSQTLPQRRRDAGVARTVTFSQQDRRSKKHKRKHCVVS